MSGTARRAAWPDRSGFGWSEKLERKSRNSPSGSLKLKQQLLSEFECPDTLVAGTGDDEEIFEVGQEDFFGGDD